MSYAISMETTGGPEVLRWQPFDPGQPQAGEVRVRHGAVGVNYIDIYHRSGLYPLPGLPYVPGLEAAGTVEVVGEGVDEFQPGDRVAYAGVPPGAYAQVRNIPAHRLVPLPDSISFTTAAAAMLQGMTARYLLKGCYPVNKGTVLLIHAAAGGVGSIVCQWASSLGATVIGTVGSQEKAEIARANGCNHPILYQEADLAKEVRELTGGRGVDVVYDSVGQSTFSKSLDCLRPMGTMVSFGQSSGPVPAFDLSILAQKGSLFLTRPSLMAYTAARQDLLDHAADLFAVIARGAVKIQVTGEYPLQNAAQAHRDLEARKTTGSLVLIP